MKNNINITIATKSDHSLPMTQRGRTNKLRHITKTCLNFDPLKPYFYIVKLRVYIISFISAQNRDCGYSLEPPRKIKKLIFFIFLLKNIDCGYSLEPPHRGGSNEYHNLCFEQKYEKYQFFLSEKFQFFR